MQIVKHDPGERQKMTTDNEREYLISLGPFQPMLPVFPSDGKNRFNAQWYEDFEFLEYSILKDAAFCFICTLFPTGVGRERSETSWTQGVRTWGKMKSCGAQKKGKLPQHFSSQAHKAALSDFCNFVVKRGHVDVIMDRNKRIQLIEQERILAFNTEAVKILVDISRTLARQGLAFRGSGNDENGNYQQIVQLISRHNLIMKK